MPGPRLKGRSSFPGDHQLTEGAVPSARTTSQGGRAAPSGLAAPGVAFGDANTRCEKSVATEAGQEGMQEGVAWGWQ